LENPIFGLVLALNGTKTTVFDRKLGKIESVFHRASIGVICKLLIPFGLSEAFSPRGGLHNCPVILCKARLNEHKDAVGEDRVGTGRGTERMRHKLPVRIPTNIRQERGAGHPRLAMGSKTSHPALVHTVHIWVPFLLTNKEFGASGI
jgi:hypothetical protein